MRDWNDDGKIDARDHYLFDVANGFDKPAKKAAPEHINNQNMPDLDAPSMILLIIISIIGMIMIIVALN